MPATAGRSERESILQTGTVVPRCLAPCPPKCWGAPWYSRLGISLHVLQEFVLPMTTLVTPSGKPRGCWGEADPDRGTLHRPHTFLLPQPVKAPSYGPSDGKEAPRLAMTLSS